MKNIRDVLLILLIVMLIINIVSNWEKIKTKGFLSFIRNIIFNPIIFILSVLIIALSTLIRLREYRYKTKG